MVSMQRKSFGKTSCPIAGSLERVGSGGACSSCATPWRGGTPRPGRPRGRAPRGGVGRGSWTPAAVCGHRGGAVIVPKSCGRRPQFDIASFDITSEEQMSKPSAIVVGVGAERGLGAALCRRFAQGGYHVLVAGRTPAKIDRVVETIVSAGGSAEPVAADATREQDVVRLF